MAEWISIKKQLPESGKWYIFTDGLNISVERYKEDAIDHFFPPGRWFNLEDAVAWMPLPEPYAEESDNPSAQLGIIRCKDCRHRPTPTMADEGITSGFSVEFPDESCPCQCADGFYNWYPGDDFYCGNAERREE